LTRSLLVPFAIEFLSFAHVELCFPFFFTGTLSIYATGYMKIVTVSVLIILSDVSIVLQTLSSLALVFALHHYKPTPLYVTDERRSIG
jgi:Kef-type K+ transport system membrane component KefB